MFWSKIKKAKKGKLTTVESQVMKYLLSTLPEKYSNLVFEQLEYLSLVKRIDYSRYSITELYPVSYGIIPKDKLFERTEEFLLAKIKFEVNGIVHNSEIHMVLGQIFDIKISPIPPCRLTDSLTFEEVFVENELRHNIYG